MSKTCKFLYRGIDVSFLMELSAPDEISFLDTGNTKSPPFCLCKAAGDFIERLYDAFESGRAVASLHVPVYARGKWELAHMDLEFHITPRPADYYDEEEHAGTWAALPADGTIKIAKYDGPASWRKEDWSKATIAASFGKD